MVEVCQNNEKPMEFVPASKLVSPEYQEILRNLEFYQKIFKFKYCEHVDSLPLLADEVGCQSVEEVKLLLNNLFRYFASIMDGQVRGDKLASVCPDCLRMTLTRYSHGEAIIRACAECGYEVGENFVDCEDFDTSIEFGSTYAPSSFLSWNKGLGDTLNHKAYLHVLLHDGSEDFEDFQKTNPALAKALQENFAVIQHGFVYHLMDEGMNVVRKVSVDEFYNALNMVFHAQDKPLRKAKVDSASKTASPYQAPLAYATELVDRYKIDKEDARNQAFLNNLGIDIRVFRNVLKAQHLHVSVKSFTETLFYINLLLHGKTELASIAEPDLKIHPGFAEYYGEFKRFLKGHQQWNTSPNGLLFALKSISCVEKP